MENISVAVKFRPSIAEETAGDRQWRIEDNRISLHKPLGTPISGISFAFDHVFEQSSAKASASSSLTPPLDEESMWQMSFRAGENMDSEPYPERPGEPDCAYYLRTGLCRFGMTCRFNHPPNKKLAVERMKGAYPERIGQPECHYYLKTGTCKFEPTCKFHHPKDKSGIIERVQLNVLGYPLRPNEKEC